MKFYLLLIMIFSFGCSHMNQNSNSNRMPANDDSGETEVLVHASKKQMYCIQLATRAVFNQFGFGVIRRRGAVHIPDNIGKVRSVYLDSLNAEKITEEEYFDSVYHTTPELVAEGIRRSSYGHDYSSLNCQEETQREIVDAAITFLTPRLSRQHAKNDDVEYNKAMLEILTGKIQN